MGRMYELSTTSMAAEAEIHSLQGMWSEIYREIAKQDVAGEEILRITATLYYGPRPRKTTRRRGVSRTTLKGVHDI